MLRPRPDEVPLTYARQKAEKHANYRGFVRVADVEQLILEAMAYERELCVVEAEAASMLADPDPDETAAARIRALPPAPPREP